MHQEMMKEAHVKELRVTEAGHPYNEQNVVCDSCEVAIDYSYYETSGKVICEACRKALERSLYSGSKLFRALRALIFGIPAAAVGAGIYYGIMAATGYEFALVSIIIGLMVGGAVRVGSNRRGGWFYQMMAMGLTYVAIVATYVPFIIEGVEAEVAQEDQIVETQTTTVSHPVGSDTPLTAAANAAPSAVGVAKTAPVSFFSLVFGSMIVAGFVLAAPFIAGFENIMGLIIIGIGLYEAWRVNRRVPVVFTGPYNVGEDRG